MNKVILMGRLTKDPELRYTSTNNTAVCRFSLAVNRRFSKQGEERQADFFDVVAWDKQAEFCSKWFQKGKQVIVVGRLQQNIWDDNEGKKHSKVEIIAEETHFAESKRSDEGAPAQRPAGGPAPAGQNDGFYPLDEDDDLPF